jgi:methylenetetrahydrofolate--tRNA-(uracil-5-)-methyltransferase
VGLTNPKTGKDDAYAVVQLRQDDEKATLYNLVGFQTNLKFGEQKRVFSMIPGLENAEFVRYGVMHRNTFLQSPKLLDRYYADRRNPLVAFAGQMTGVEGYVESAASGYLAAVAMAAKVQGREIPDFPKTTAIGALGLHISDPTVENFQPMNINFSIIAPLEQRIRKKAEKNLAIANRSLSVIDGLLAKGI